MLLVSPATTEFSHWDFEERGLVNEILAILALIFIAIRGARNGVLFPRPRRAKACVTDEIGSADAGE